LKIINIIFNKADVIEKDYKYLSNISNSKIFGFTYLFCFVVSTIIYIINNKIISEYAQLFIKDMDMLVGSIFLLVVIGFIGIPILFSVLIVDVIIGPIHRKAAYNQPLLKCFLRRILNRVLNISVGSFSFVFIKLNIIPINMSYQSKLMFNCVLIIGFCWFGELIYKFIISQIYKNNEIEVNSH
jgi:hypothetical protein